MKINIAVPEKDKKIISKIIKAVKNSKSAFITWHARPDSDAIGGGLALSNLLKKYISDVEIISPTPPAKIYKYFKDIDVIKTSIPVKKKEVGFIIDCSDISRLESVSELSDCAETIINIDHHRLNSNFGEINYVRQDASSVCELILNIAIEMDYAIDYDFAFYIYIGIVTDTNKFQEQNTSARSHRIAAELIEKLISPVKIASLIYGDKEISTINLFSRAIGTLKLSSSGKVGYITITPKMLSDTGTLDENTEGIIDYARNIKGVEVGILFKKIEGLNGIKVSFRSKGKIDVSRLAGRFGGGGHHNAAGCFVSGDFDKVINKVIDEAEKGGWNSKYQ